MYLFCYLNRSNLLKEEEEVLIEECSLLYIISEAIANY